MSRNCANPKCLVLALLSSFPSSSSFSYSSFPLLFLFPFSLIKVSLKRSVRPLAVPPSDEQEHLLSRLRPRGVMSFPSHAHSLASLSLTVASLAKEKVMEMLLSMDFAFRVGVVELRSHCECWTPFSVLFTSMWSRKFGLFENNFAVGPCAFL